MHNCHNIGSDAVALWIVLLSLNVVLWISLFMKGTLTEAVYTWAGPMRKQTKVCILAIEFLSSHVFNVIEIDE